MLNAHLSHFKIVGDLIPSCELSHAFAVLCRLDVLIRYKVIRNKSDFILVKDTLDLEFLHFLNCNRACDVVAQHKIQICFDQLSRLDLIQSRRSRKDLLCHCHSHTLYHAFLWFFY